MHRAVWLVVAAGSLMACGINDPVTRRLAAEAGNAGAVDISDAGSLSDAGEGGAAGDGAAGIAGAIDTAGAAHGGSGGHLVNGEAGAPSVAGGGAGAGGSATAGHGGEVSGAGGSAGAESLDPDCAPSNLHPLHSKCAGPQPINCALGISGNPNLCTGGSGACPGIANKECRSYEDDFQLCRDGRFRSSPAGTCGTVSGPGLMQRVEDDVAWPQEFCPCVVMGVAVDKN